MKYLELHCFSLERTTIAQRFYEVRLPCSRDEAHEFLALHFGTKSLMLPPETNVAYRIPFTPFFIRKISTWEKIHHHFDSLYPLLAEDRWFHLRQRLIAYIPVLLQLALLEKAVPETIFEVFTLTNGFLLKGPPPVSRVDDLVLAQIHFWSPTDNFTYVAIMFGWKDETHLGMVYKLFSLLEGYINRIIELFDPKGDKFFFKLPSKLTPNVGQTLPTTVPTAPLENPTGTFEEADDLRISTPYGSTGLEERHKIIDAPRFYSSTVASICFLAAIRQRNINSGKKIVNLRKARKKIGPSVNTMRKLPELVNNWNNPDYHWNVDSWLRKQTAHTPNEISQILSDLQEGLTEEVWDLVTSTSGKKPSERVSKNGANQ